MPPHRVHCRTIVEEVSYQTSLNECKLSHEKVDQALEGVTFALARDPGMFPEAPGGLKRVRVRAVAYKVALNVWFRFDDEQVYLTQLDLVDENGDEQ